MHIQQQLACTSDVSSSMYSVALQMLLLNVSRRSDARAAAVVADVPSNAVR